MTARTMHKQPETTELSPPASPSLQDALKEALECICAAKRTGDGSLLQTAEPLSLVQTFVRSVLFRAYPSKCATDIADIGQEVLMRVWKNIESYDSARPAQSWLAAIASRTAIDSWRREGRGRLSVIHGNPHCDVFEGFEFLPDQGKVDPAEIVSDAEEVRQRVSATRRAIEALPEGQRDAIKLDLQDMSISDIAQSLGIPDGTVKSRIHAGKARLKALLRDIED